MPSVVYISDAHAVSLQDDNDTKYAQAATAAAAGAIGVLTTNFLFLALFGKETPVAGDAPAGANKA